MSDNLQQSDEVRGKSTVPEPCSDHPDTESADTDAEGSPENPQENPEVPSLADQLLEKDEELYALNDKYLRLAAEFDNYKRRVQRDQQDTIRFANEKLFKDLLPTLDNLERALQSGREQGRIEGLMEGVDLTYKHFLDTLQKMGIKQVSSVGEVFDPAKHQAVGQVESDTIPENVIVDEYQKGYFVHDRILRPAMVTVAKTKEPDNGEGQQEGAEA